MNLAQIAWENNRIAAVLNLLEQHRPQHGQDDLRCFEWYYWDRLCHSEILNIGEVTSVVFSPDGRTTEGISIVAFSPDGRRIASVDGYHESQGNELKLWDAGTGRELLSLKRHHHPVGAIAFSRDGHQLLSAAPSENGDGVEIRTWDATPLQKVPE